MANRPVFRTWKKNPFVARSFVEFEWFSGFSKAQKQRSIQSLHENFKRQFPGQEVLEISSKSMQEGGCDLSAFSLSMYVESVGRKVPVENIYQASKVFKMGGPYTDLLLMSPKDAKRDERLKNSGKFMAYEFEGKRYPITPTHLFYDYIYMKALSENPVLAKIVLSYDAFTDIEFNPDRQLNCQARAAAKYKSLYEQGLLGVLADYASYEKLMNSE